jgi:hypothetical protein
MATDTLGLAVVCTHASLARSATQIRDRSGALEGLSLCSLALLTTFRRVSELALFLTGQHIDEHPWVTALLLHEPTESQETTCTTCRCLRGIQSRGHGENGMSSHSCGPSSDDDLGSRVSVFLLDSHRMFRFHLGE